MPESGKSEHFIAKTVFLEAASFLLLSPVFPVTPRNLHPMATRMKKCLLPQVRRLGLCAVWPAAQAPAAISGILGKRHRSLFLLPLCAAGGLSTAHAILTPTINSNGVEIVYETPTEGITISLADLQAIITARGDLTTAAVMTRETEADTAMSLQEELNGAKFFLSGPVRWSRGDGGESRFLPTASGSRFGFINISETWSITSLLAPGEGATHFGFISSGLAASSHLTSVVANFSDGSSEEIFAQGIEPGTESEFVGIAAPEGTTIVSVVINEGSGGEWMPYDDVVIVIAPPPVDPPDDTNLWVGAGANAKWSTTANWTANAVPREGRPLYFGGTQNLAAENDLATGRAYDGLSFQPGSGSFNLTGNTLSPGGVITNNSASDQTVALPLMLSDTLEISTLGAPVALTGPISGPAGVTKKTGAARLTLGGANTYTGPLIVRDGAVLLTGDQTGARGGISLPNTVATDVPAVIATPTLTLEATAKAAVGEDATLDVGGNGSGIFFPRFNVNGTLDNAGSLSVLRGGILSVGGTLTQSGPAFIQGNGGYGATLIVSAGGVFDYTGTTEFSLPSAASNDAGRSRLTLDGGVFKTGSSLMGPGEVGFPSLVTLTNGGVLQLTNDIDDLAMGLTLLLQDGEGVIDTNGHDTALTSPILSTITTTPPTPVGVGSFVKAGAGTLTLTAETNLWEGGTIVRGGSLALEFPTLSDTALVEIAAGAVLHLAFSDTDAVGALTFGGVAQAAGTWGAPGSGAQHTDARFSGPGRLLVDGQTPQEATIAITPTGTGSVTITWTGGVLQTSPNLKDWTRQEAAVSPLTETVSDGKFYRVVP